MIIKSVKTIQLNDEERIILRSAQDVLVTLNDELSDDDIDDLICGLDQVIYSDGWEVEEGKII